MKPSLYSCQLTPRLRSLDLLPSRFLLVLTLRTQALWLCELNRLSTRSGSLSGYVARKRFLISTSRFGSGQKEGSDQTPLGLHRVAEKIGGGQPIGTVFQGRRPIGYTWAGFPLAPITNRILWLEGLEPGLNRGPGVDSKQRYIYIHGTCDEPTLGRPASRGCIHLAADDLIPLYDQLPVGTLVWIE